MKIIKYNNAEIYNFKPEDTGYLVHFFPEGALVLSENEIEMFNTRKQFDLEYILTWLWDNRRIEEYGSESD